VSSAESTVRLFGALVAVPLVPAPRDAFVSQRIASRIVADSQVALFENARQISLDGRDHPSSSLFSRGLLGDALAHVDPGASRSKFRSGAAISQRLTVSSVDQLADLLLSRKGFPISKMPPGQGSDGTAEHWVGAGGLTVHLTVAGVRDHRLTVLVHDVDGQSGGDGRFISLVNMEQFGEVTGPAVAHVSRRWRQPPRSHSARARSPRRSCGLLSALEGRRRQGPRGAPSDHPDPADPDHGQDAAVGKAAGSPLRAGGGKDYLPGERKGGLRAAAGGIRVHARRGSTRPSPACATHYAPGGRY